MVKNKSQKAKIRNWNKLRASGFKLDTKLLTSDERILYSQIQEKLNELLSHWDINTVKLGFNVYRYNLIDKKTKEIIYRGLNKTEVNLYKTEEHEIKRVKQN